MFDPDGSIAKQAELVKDAPRKQGWDGLGEQRRKEVHERATLEDKDVL
jgi:hypothetical protein